ncbi:hypothetical protein NDU88_003343, partial [Pleurodeles waltl]
SPHIMLTGGGANLYADKLGFSQVPTDELVTDNARREWKQYQRYKQAVGSLFSKS